MKKFLSILILSTISFSNFLNTNFSAKIYEKNKSQTKEYSLKYTPNKIRVQVEFPKINKGEVYTYENGKKYIYYPRLKQTVEQSISNSDNDIFKLLEEMKKISKTSKVGNKVYTVENKKIVNIKAMNYNANIKYNGQMPSYILVTNGNEKVEFIWKY